jgi:hypothetical protein
MLLRSRPSSRLATARSVKTTNTLSAKLLELKSWCSTNTACASAATESNARCSAVLYSAVPEISPTVFHSRDKSHTEAQTCS